MSYVKQIALMAIAAIATSTVATAATINVVVNGTASHAIPTTLCKWSRAFA